MNHCNWLIVDLLIEDFVKKSPMNCFLQYEAMLGGPCGIVGRFRFECCFNLIPDINFWADSACWRINLEFCFEKMVKKHIYLKKIVRN